MILYPYRERRPAGMTHPYSEDLRERAMARLNAGETIRSIAAALAIGPTCVSKWKKRLAETGALTPGRVGGRKQWTLSCERADWLRQRCRSGPFTTRGLVAELAEPGIKTERRAVWVFVRAEGLSFKKTVLPAEQTRVDIARKRLRKTHQRRIEARRLVFLDETWIKTNMAVRAAGAHLFFLPPYSPDLNPIEQVFAKLKHLIRRQQPRTAEATWRKAGEMLDCFSPAECANYLANSGYASV